MSKLTISQIRIFTLRKLKAFKTDGQRKNHTESDRCSNSGTSFELFHTPSVLHVSILRPVSTRRIL